MSIFIRRRLILIAGVSLVAVPSVALAQDVRSFDEDKEALSAAQENEDALVFDEDGLTLTTGELQLNLGGRVHVDGVTYDDGLISDSTADFRRARIEFSARLGQIVSVRVDREFAGVDGWRNVWVAVRPVKDVEIKGGNVIVPFSLEDMQSSNRITLIERSLVNALAPGFGLGVGARYSHDNFTIAGGYFDEAIDDADGRSSIRGDGFAVRATFAPIRESKQFLHFGAAYESRSINPAIGALNPLKQVRYSSNLGSQLTPSLISTGGISNVTGIDNFGAEFAYGNGPLQVQAQYISSQIDQLGGPGLDFGGYYAQASWMITGESYKYSRSSGTTSGPRLKRGKGAVELAARYSDLDLDDPARDTGKASALTFGANWYLNENVRVMANYVHSETRNSLLNADQSADAGIVRFQLSF